MGHIKYLSGMSRDEAMPLGINDATGVSQERARLAVDVAKASVAAAQNAHYLVTSQAVRLVSECDYSTREIADILGISKSSVHRHQRSDGKALAARNVEQVSKLVRQAWGSSSLPLSVEQLNDLAARRGQSPGMDEALRASQEKRAPGIDWPYQLRVYRFGGSYEATRDSFVMALGQSAWMAASLADAGSSSKSTLWGLCEELKAAKTKARFDQVLMAVYELADQNRCWIEFVEPPQI